MELEIKKIIPFMEETLIKGFKKVEKPVRIAASLAVIKNPYAGRYVKDLHPLIKSCSAQLGELFRNVNHNDRRQ
ncbi:amino acid synthesis family protein [Bacillota bacterium Lsc_1132]